MFTFSLLASFARVVLRNFLLQLGSTSAPNVNTVALVLVLASFSFWRVWFVNLGPRHVGQDFLILSHLRRVYIFSVYFYGVKKVLVIVVLLLSHG